MDDFKVGLCIGPDHTTLEPLLLDVAEVEAVWAVEAPVGTSMTPFVVNTTEGLVKVELRINKLGMPNTIPAVPGIWTTLDHKKLQRGINRPSQHLVLVFTIMAPGYAQLPLEVRKLVPKFKYRHTILALGSERYQRLLKQI